MVHASNTAVNNLHDFVLVAVHMYGRQTRYTHRICNTYLFTGICTSFQNQYSGLPIISIAKVYTITLNVHAFSPHSLPTQIQS